MGNVKLTQWAKKSFGGLGISNQRARGLWDPIIRKMEAWLVKWKVRFLSKTRRLVLIKTSLRPLPIYFISLFKMPRMHQIGWGLICRKKSFGGLGIRKLRDSNFGLLTKWLWREENNP